MRATRKSLFRRDAETNARDGRAPRNADEVRRPSIADLFVAVMGNPQSAIRNRQSEVEETK